MIIAYLLLVAPVLAAVLFWGSWGWVAAAAGVAVAEYMTLRRSQRFLARVWRSVGIGRRSSRERVTESMYLVTALAGIGLLVVAVFGSLR